MLYTLNNIHAIYIIQYTCYIHYTIYMLYTLYNIHAIYIIQYTCYIHYTIYILYTLYNIHVQDPNKNYNVLLFLTITI